MEILRVEIQKEGSWDFSTFRKAPVSDDPAHSIGLVADTIRHNFCLRGSFGPISAKAIPEIVQGFAEEE